MTQPPRTAPHAPETRADVQADPARGWTVFEERDKDEAGTVIDQRFELCARIGDGGMARVYACKDLVLGSLAALKVMKGNNADARRRFAEEARLLANVRHPHLVAVLMTGQTEDGAPYMVLEYLPGRSLDERLRDDGPLPWREVVQSAIQVARALEVLHGLGVIHRDVKPGNIMQLDSAAGQLVVKLLDLGIAKVHDWQRVQAAGFKAPPRHQTDVGKVIGTPGFSPPEGGHVSPDPRFDVFGLGVTIYQLCTGEMPDLVQPRPMRQVRPDCEVPPELDAVVMAAITVLPEDRIATIAELRVRIEAIGTAPREGAKSVLFEGAFELIEVIGVGAKAEVYRAYGHDAGRYMALKVLSAKARELPEERARFAREARILGALEHPTIPRAYECRTSDSQRAPYIAMSLARGKRAGEFCTEANRLGAADVIAVGRQLAAALVVAHARGILHRDINTSNVLIDLGRETTAMLVDFGMADFEAAFYAVVEQRYPTPPEARGRLGTGGLERLEWTAPEARRGEGWTGVSDVYSLALLLYRLLTGKRPTRGGDTELIDPRALVRDCPAGLALTLLAGLQPDPALRPDAAELRQRLDEAAEELHGSVGDEDLEESTRPAPSRVDDVSARPNAVLAVPPVAPAAPRRPARAVAALLVAAAVVGLWWVYTPARQDVPLGADSAVSTIPSPLPPTLTPTVPASASQAQTITGVPAHAGSVADELAAVTSTLTDCAQRAGREIFVELATSPGEPRFTAIDISCDDLAGTACARGVLQEIRFDPPATAAMLVKGYRP